MDSEAIFIGGRSGVGKTSVGLEMHTQLSAAGLSHCLIAGDFLDMTYPPPWEDRLAEQNFANELNPYRGRALRASYTHGLRLTVTDPPTTATRDTVIVDEQVWREIDLA